MANLLELHATPLKLGIKVNHGSLNYHRGDIDLKISRERNGLSLKHEFPKLKIDTFEARTSIFPTAMQYIEQSADKGIQAAQNACAVFARHGVDAMECPIGEEVITQHVVEDIFKNVKMNIGIEFLPKTGPKIQFTSGSLESHYEMDRLSFEWRTPPPTFDHTYTDVDISVDQYPDVKIQYVAGIHRVPDSANDGTGYLDIKA